MYNSVVRILAAVLTAAVLCGCSMSKDTAAISIEKVEYETDTSTVYVERPTFSFMKNKELMGELNDAYEAETDSALVAFDTKTLEAPELAGGNKYVFEIHQDIKYNGNDFISIVSEDYEYTGGAHGSTVRLAKNVDTLTGITLTLADLFEDNAYKSTLDRMILEAVENNPDEYSDLWEKPQIKDSNQTDFYISEQGLVVFYQPYDLSYYARGFVEFTFPFDEISGYMKEEYRRLGG